MVLGNRIREYRQLRKLSLRDLSRLSGIDIGQLHRMETENSGCSDERKLRLCEVLGVSLTDLFFQPLVENNSTSTANEVPA